MATHKKAHLTLKRNPKDTVTVKVGDKLKRGDTVIAVPKATVDEFNLAKLLKLTPAAALKCLGVKDGEHIHKGHVIATRKVLLSKQVVRSPIDGIFTIIDKEKAIVGVAKEVGGHDIIAWSAATVVEVNDEKVVLEVSGLALVGLEGKGVPTSGMLLVISSPIDAFALPTDLEERILVLPEAEADLLAKADALGVAAVIAQKVEQPPFSLPYVLTESIEPYLRFHGRHAIIYGDEKQILIIEEKDSKPDKK